MTPGEFGQNEAYVGQRLLFQRSGEVEVGLTDAVDGSELRRVLRWTIGVGVLIFVLLALMSGVLRVLGGRSLISQLLFGLAVLLPWVWVVPSMLVRRVEVLSDWHLLLDGRAEVADAAFDVVRRSLAEEHRIPARISVRRVRVRRPSWTVRNLLRVDMGRYRTYVSIFAFGRDLYFGWALWRTQWPIGIIWRWLFARGDRGFLGLVEMEPVKAMREVVHNSLRQAVEAVVADRLVPLVDTFGHDVPVESLDGPPPSVVTVVHPTEVFSPDDGRPVGHALPGTTYHVVGDDPVTGLTVRDEAGAVAVLRDRSAVRW